MFGSNSDLTQPVPESTTLEDEQVSGTTEAAPVKYLAGTHKIAVTWISPIYNQHALPAPVERPGKK